MKIRLVVFGPEVTRLLERDQVIDLAPSSTVDDLAQKLEAEIKAKYGSTPNLLRSNFTILINGRPAETIGNRALKDGDSVALLSPVGGG